MLGTVIEGWKISALRALEQEPGVRLEIVFLDETSSSSRARRPLWAGYQEWSSRSGNPFHLQDSLAVLRETPRARAALLDRSRQLRPDARALLTSKQLDVVLWLGDPPSGGQCAGMARFGVWRFCPGNPARNSGHPPYFREAYDRDTFSEFLILAHLENFDEAAVIYRNTWATTEGWPFNANAIRVLDCAGVFLLRRLLDILEFGPDHFRGRICCATVACDRAKPTYASTLTLMRYLARQVGRSLRLRYQRGGRSLQWFTAIRWNREAFTDSRERFTGFGLRAIAPHSACSEADPFVIEHGGRQFLFFEEVPDASGRGRISVRQIQEDFTSTQAVTVLERPYHVSYPFLIQNNGHLFMIPETSENDTVELYRCTEFPHEWRLERVICEGVALVDTTVFHRDGTWFFFTTSAETGELLLFYSDALDGTWEYHRSNPISSDVRNARSAGALFRRGSTLIRPAQDASVRYGGAITLNEVTALGRSEYSEQLIETIYPTWSAGLLGTHTINANDRVEVIDGLRYGK